MRIGSAGSIRAVLRASQHSALVVLVGMAVIGLVISPVRELSAFRFGLFALGVSVLCLLGTQYMTYRFAPAEALVQLLPRVPAGWLTALGTSEGINANEAAGVLATMLPAFIGAMLWRANGDSRVRFTLQLITTVLIALYLLLSVSRTAWLALLPPLLGLLWLRRRAFGLVALSGTVLAVLAGFVLLPTEQIQMLLFSDLSTPQWFAIPTRYVIWQHGLALLSSSPLAGIGIGAFPVLFHARVLDQPFYANSSVIHAHSLYLQAALDVGIVGMLAYVVVLFGAAYCAYRVGRAAGVSPSAGIALGLAAGLITFSLFGILQVIQLTARAGPLVWYVIALAAATRTAWQAPRNS